MIDDKVHFRVVVAGPQQVACWFMGRNHIVIGYYRYYYYARIIVVMLHDELMIFILYR